MRYTERDKAKEGRAATTSFCFLVGIVKEQKKRNARMAIFKELIAENDVFKLNLHSRAKHGNKNRFMPKHIVTKLHNAKDKEIFWKS